MNKEMFILCFSFIGNSFRCHTMRMPISTEARFNYLLMDLYRHNRTEIRGIVRRLADVADLCQERDQLPGRAVVYARAPGQHVHVVEHVEQ